MDRQVRNSAFDKFLRTGWRPASGDWSESKFNPYHDPEDGRFTFGPGTGGSLSPRATAVAARRSSPVSRAAPKPARLSSPDPIGDIIERALHDHAADSNNLPEQSGGDHASRAKSVLTHWPIPGGSVQSLNSPDKPGEGGPRYGAPRPKRSKHRGVDLKAPAGSIVQSAGPGMVVKIAPNPSSSFGEQIVIYHGNGIYTHYAHLQFGSTTVKPGSKVKAGQMIGKVGRTGNTPRTGDSHLHFEVRIGSGRPATAGGQTRDPLPMLPR